MAGRHTSYEPLPRSEHAAVAVDNKLHMWGGEGESKEKSQKLAQKLEVFDISTEQWEQKPTHGTPPPGLWGAAYAVVGSCLFVFGGWDGRSRYNNFFKLDLRTYQWEKVQVSSRGPQKKSGCRMVSYGDNRLVVFAGWTGSVWTDELHVFDLNKGEYIQSVHQTTSQAILYGSCGAVRKFRWYVWSDCYTHSDSEWVQLRVHLPQT